MFLLQITYTLALLPNIVLIQIFEIFFSPWKQLVPFISITTGLCSFHYNMKTRIENNSMDGRFSKTAHLAVIKILMHVFSSATCMVKVWLSLIP